MALQVADLETPVDGMFAEQVAAPPGRLPRAKAVFAWDEAAGAAAGDLHFQVSRHGLQLQQPRMDHPCCSCKLTRVRSSRFQGGDLIEVTDKEQPGEGWITGRGPDGESLAYSCSPCGEPLLQL